MKEYLITVTSEVTKHFMIDASSNEEAICTALDFFVEETTNPKGNDTKMSNVKVNIESIGELDADEINE